MVTVIAASTSRTRSRSTISSAMVALIATTRNVTPYAPKTSAIWQTASSGVCVWPTYDHGQPVNRLPRTNSQAVQMHATSRTTNALRRGRGCSTFTHPAPRRMSAAMPQYNPMYRNEPSVPGTVTNMSHQMFSPKNNVPPAQLHRNARRCDGARRTYNNHGTRPNHAK
jgi:hypothetical protein